jgi:3-methyladenine DNA glycosylase AlkD/uncharacterized protein YdhG (YjbR/CyaY superfamily)
VPAKPRTVDDYLAGLPADQRRALQRLREQIHAAAPKAEECISYQLPTFRQGRVLVGFGATAKHCAFFPMSSTTVAAHARELADFDTSKGTIRFQPGRPLPAALVRKLVKARLAENAAGDARVFGAKRTSKDQALAALERRGSRRVADGMSRYGIATADRVIGVSMSSMQALAKEIGKDHELATELWTTKCYEARMLASLIGQPAELTLKQMDAWVADFDNWAICDTVCFKLFDQTPLAWQRVERWSKSPREFVKRTGYALIACLALHDRTTDDALFVALLPLIEEGARDERNFVKKGVSWALRGIGRRGPKARAAALALAKRLARSDDAPSRWVGKDALRDLSR